MLVPNKVLPRKPGLFLETSASALREEPTLPAVEMPATVLLKVGCGDPTRAPRPHTLACRSMLERENVSEHIGHSALIFVLS